jgi:hypothetical protein
MRLPWLLGNDEQHQDEWLTLLFGNDVPSSAGQATWEAYLVYSRFFSRSVPLLAPQYEAALTDLIPRPEENGISPMDPDEMLGVHAAMSHLFALPPALEHHWLARYYGSASDWVRGRVTRWIAEQASHADATPEVRERAVIFLRERVPDIEMPGDEEELKALVMLRRALGQAELRGHVRRNVAKLIP